MLILGWSEKLLLLLHYLWKMCGYLSRVGGGGALWISKDMGDQKIFLGLKFRFWNFFGQENLASIFVWVAWFK